MQNLEDYTPEMLVFYQNLPAPVQNAVRHADVELEDLYWGETVCKGHH